MSANVSVSDAVSNHRCPLRRDHICEALLQHAASSVQILCAPAGYGKSSILDELRERLELGGIAILDLARGQRQTPIGGNASQSHGSAVHPPYAVLIDGEGAFGPARECRIVADIEAHTARGAGLVIATRSRSFADMLTLRIRARVASLSHEALAFTRKEIRALFRDELIASELGRVHALTEGWPYAVRLLHVDFLQSARRNQWRANIGELNDRLTRFFDRELFALLAADDQALLLDAARLNRADPAVIEELFPQKNTSSRLANLCGKGTLAHKVPEHRSAYRLHPLFRDYLRRMRPNVRDDQEFQRRAAESFEAHGCMEGALEHARASGDSLHEAQILERCGGFKSIFADSPRVAGYFQAISPQVGKSHPMILLGKLYLMIKDSGPHLTARRCDAFAADGYFGTDRRVSLYEKMVRHAIALNDGDPLQLSDISATEEEFAPEIRADWFAQAIMYELAAAHYYRNGRIASALLYSQRVVQCIGSEDAGLLRLFANLRASSAKLRSGDSQGANSLVSDALSGLHGTQGRAQELSVCQVLSARLRVERLEYRQASELLANADDLIESHAGWYEGVEAQLITGAAVRCQLEDADAALAYLERACAAFRRGGYQLNLLLARILKGQILLRQGRLDEADEEIHDEPLPTVLALDTRELGSCTDAPLLQLKLDWALCRLQLALLRDPTGTDLPQIEALSGAVAETCDAFLALRYQLVVLRWLLLRENMSAAARRVGVVVRMAAQSGAIRCLAEEWAWIKPIAREAKSLGLVRPREARLIAILDPTVSTGSAIATPVKLSARELQVLRFLAGGLSSKEMSTNLGISIGTVKSYRRSLYTKLGIFTRSAAVSFARNHRLDQIEAAGS